MDTLRTLFLGVLAVKEKMVEPAQLAEVYAAWLGRQETSLLTLLEERGYLEAGATAKLEVLADQQLAKHQGDLRAGLAAVEPRVWQSLADRLEPTVNKSISAALLPPAAAETDNLRKVRRLFEGNTEAPPAPGERYRRLHPHAAGGIGQIWMVRDVHLGRDVALKELRPETAQDGEYRARFLEEARITGQLEHPGIVPVYELAVTADAQQPFYIMRFVKGRTLSAAIADYHRALASPSGRGDPLARNALLNAFIGVCNALAYAHARGIIHRDLKGQNVILGDFGEVIVLDWGLAKRLQEPGTAHPVETGITGASPFSRLSSPSFTQAGQVMGTPAYMAPEQAAGGPMDERTDIYGLGAMLYEILTGRPPFSSSDSAPVPESTGNTPEIKKFLRRIIEEAPPPPRQIRGDVPAALEAVCLKAIAKDPSRRYASAGDLAREIQRWLADEPVHAYPEPLRLRMGRWARRNKAMVSSGFVLLLAAVVGLTITTVLIGQEQARTDAAAKEAHENFLFAQKETKRALDNLKLAEREGKRAEANFRLAQKETKRAVDNLTLAEKEGERAQENFLLAQDAVDRYFVQISEERLLHEPRMQKLREDLLQLARDYYEKFIAKHSDDPKLRADLGKAMFKLGMVSADLGKLDQAVKTLDKAIPLFKALASANPEVQDYRVYLGRCHTRRGAFLLRLERHAEAEKDCLEAQDILEKLNLPRHLDVQRGLAHSAGNLGLIHERKGQKKLELAAHLGALELYQNLANAFPDNPTVKDELAGGHTNLATHYAALKEYPLAVEHTRKAQKYQEELVEKYPDVFEYQRSLAKSFNNLGNLLGKQDPEALDLYRRALEIRKKIAEQNPRVPDYQSELAAIHLNIGRYYMFAADVARKAKDEKRIKQALADAEGSFQAALEVGRKLAADYPRTPRYRAEAAVAASNMGNIRFQDNPKVARAFYEEAIPPLEEALKTNPHSQYYRLPLRDAYWGLAELGAPIPGKVHPWQRALELDDGERRPALHSGWLTSALGMLKKDHAAAVREADALARQPDLSLSILAGLGSLYASCTIVAEDAKQAVAEQYAARSVAIYLRAEKAGLLEHPAAAKTLERYLSIPTIAARADFQALLKRAKEKQK